MLLIGLLFIHVTDSKELDEIKLIYHSTEKIKDYRVRFECII